MLKTLLATALLLLAIAPPGAAEQSIPPFPRYYVLDEPGLLNPQQIKALETILIEHDQTTGEQIVVALFKSANGEEIAQRTHQIFENWQVGKRGQDNGALLVLYADEHQGGLESGYGLQALDESQNRAIVRDFLVPELRAGHPYRSLGLSVLELLRAVQSPLIESGRAEQLLQLGGLTGSLRPAARGLGRGSWFAFVLAGALLFAAVFSNVIAAEAHFTGEGWFRPKPSLNGLKTLASRRERGPATRLGGSDGSW